MATINITGNATQTKTFEILVCSPVLTLACTVSSIANLKKYSCLERGEDTSFHDEKSYF